MTDAAVGFLFDNVGRLLKDNVELISNVKDVVEGLQIDLKILKAFLKDAVEERRELEVVKVLIHRIRDLTFQMEDAIDTYVSEAAILNAKKRSKKIFSSGAHVAMLLQVAGTAKEVKAAVERVQRDQTYILALQRANLGGPSPTAKKPPDVERDNVVGFDEKTTDLIGLLTEKTEDLQVISVIGMPGLGKTTLANKVYNDPRVVDAFSTRAWIYVSQYYTKKDLLLSFLKSEKQATTATDVQSLVEKVKKHLTWKYLIVLDDVWEITHWDEIKEAFPNCKNGSRILLTSQIENVGEHANRLKNPYKLDFLTEHQSWELLRIKAFGQRECPPDSQDLIPLGEEIARKCNGLPLVVMVIGGFLQTKNRKDQWQIIAQNVDAHVKDERNQIFKVLDQSYHHLPPHLKACFLYFGVFPKKFDIPVWILIRLWIAERFVQTIDNVSLEEVAKDYLDELTARNLVLVVERSFSGRIKKCRVHDVLRSLCVQKAREESFLLEIKENGRSGFGLDRHHRLCIHSDVLNYISSKPYGPCVRSFLCFAEQKVKLPEDLEGWILEKFKLLRTYHVEPVTFYQFPSEIYKLPHLTYVAFSGDFKSIPSAISKLWNLQTLIAKTTSRKEHIISIQGDILRMPHFRHLHTNKASQLLDIVAKTSMRPHRRMQTLNTITPESCTEDILGQTPYIKKLGIRGKLTTLFEGIQGCSLFDNLKSLQQLVTLKLLNDVYPETPEHKLQDLPQSNNFPPNLVRLTLADTFLDWKQMDVLAMLVNLEELKLKDNAFKGERWDLVDGGFKKLIALQIWKTNLEFWEAKAYHFPKLQNLFLRDCTNLVAVPFSLGSVTTLRNIKLHKTSPSAAASAKKIKKWRQDQSKVYPGLKVEIFPPDLGQASSSEAFRNSYVIEIHK